MFCWLLSFNVNVPVAPGCPGTGLPKSSTTWSGVIVAVSVLVKVGGSGTEASSAAAGTAHTTDGTSAAAQGQAAQRRTEHGGGLRDGGPSGSRAEPPPDPRHTPKPPDRVVPGRSVA